MQIKKLVDEINFIFIVLGIEIKVKMVHQQKRWQTSQA